MKSYQDKATLLFLHTQKKLTLTEIAKAHKVSRTTIQRWMRAHNIPILTSGPNHFEGKKHSPETKCRMSQKRRHMAGGWSIDREILVDMYVRRNLSVTKIAAKIGCNHVTISDWLDRYGIPKRPRGAVIRGERNPTFGKPRSEGTKEKLRTKLIGRTTGTKNGRWGKPPKPGKGAWYMKPNGLRVWLRSSYEIRVARALDSLSIEWLYESCRFVLKDRTYCPDFYLPESDEYLEVKGWFDPRSQETMRQFYEIYPHIKLRIIRKSDMEELEAQTQNAALARAVA